MLWAYFIILLAVLVDLNKLILGIAFSDSKYYFVPVCSSLAQFFLWLHFYHSDNVASVPHAICFIRCGAGATKVGVGLE